MTYEEGYFKERQYSNKVELLHRHVLEVLRWASKTLSTNLLDGHGKRALDVGCALGYTSAVLTDLGYETYGLDISKWGIKQAKIQSGSQFLVCNVQGMIPFLADVFDLVTCFDVLEHLPYPEKTLTSMFEATKGTVVCTTPNKKVEKPIRKLMRDYDETHISVKSPTEWNKYLSCYDHNTIRVEAFYDFEVQFGGKLFFKSFRIPKYGLTVRIVVKK